MLDMFNDITICFYVKRYFKGILFGILISYLFSNVRFGISAHFYFSSNIEAYRISVSVAIVLLSVHDAYYISNTTCYFNQKSLFINTVWDINHPIGLVLTLQYQSSFILIGSLMNHKYSIKCNHSLQVMSELNCNQERIMVGIKG